MRIRHRYIVLPRTWCAEPRTALCSSVLDWIACDERWFQPIPRLGQKIPLSLEELSAHSLSPIYSASLTAMGLEECDVVTARLDQTGMRTEAWHGGTDAANEKRTVAAELSRGESGDTRERSQSQNREQKDEHPRRPRR